MPKTYVAEFAEYWLPKKKMVIPSSKEGCKYLLEDYAKFINIILSYKFKLAGETFERDNTAIAKWIYSKAPTWVVVMLKEIHTQWREEERQLMMKRYSHPNHRTSSTMNDISSKPSSDNSTFQGRSRW